MSGTTRDFPSLFFVCMAIIASRFSAGGQKRTNIYFQISSVECGRSVLSADDEWTPFDRFGVSRCSCVTQRVIIMRKSLALVNEYEAQEHDDSHKHNIVGFFFSSPILISSGLISNLNQSKKNWKKKEKPL